MEGLPIRLSIWALCLLCGFSLRGQEYHIEQFDTSEGLSSATITDVHKDRLGYLWAATSHGLNRYNGTEFSVFRYNPEDSFSIRANGLSRLFEDRNANIWVTLEIGGITKYDRHSGRFHYFTYDPTNRANTNNFVTEAFSDSRSRTWIGTGSHINLVDESTGRFVPVTIEGHDEVEVYSIYEDRNAHIWVGTAKGLFRFDTKKQYFTEVLDAKKQHIEEVIRYTQDAQGKLWFSTYYDIYRWNGNQTELMRGPSGRFITNLYTDPEGRVSISQYQDNIYSWTKDGWQSPKGYKQSEEGLRFSHSQSDIDHTLTIGLDNIVRLLDTRTGRADSVLRLKDQVTSFWLGPKSEELWLGTVNSGLYKIDLSPEEARHVLFRPKSERYSERFNNYVAAMTPLDAGQFLVSAGSHLFIFYPETDERTAIGFAGLEQVEKADIRTISAIGDSRFLMGTNEGLFTVDLKAKKVSRPPLQFDGEIFDHIIDGDTVWSIGSYGLAHGSLTSGKVTYFRELLDIPKVLQGNNIRAIHQSRDGMIWLGTIREGLFKLKPGTTQSYHLGHYQYTGVRKGPFKSHTVNEILEDRTGRLWIGGYSIGLLEFDREKEVFINHNPQNELPIPNIQGLVEAADGTIWASALNGVHRYDTETEAYDHFTIENGLSEANFILRVAAGSATGQVLFGTRAGLTVFDGLGIDKDISEAKILIESLSVPNLEQIRFPSEAADLSFQHDQDFLSFQFVDLDFHNADKLTYRYRLEGLETEWTTGKSRQVQYANLQPGNYRFEVQASLDGKRWSTTTASATFSIQKPFWWQLWFLALVVLAVIFVLYLFYRFGLNAKLSKLRALETVRQNAAADFHDEMGNKLTRISLFTEVLEKKLNGTSPEIKSYVTKIKDNSHVLNNTMRDFLWTLDPQKDTAFDLIAMLKDFGDELFNNSPVAFRVESIRSVFREYPLDMEWKQHLIMIFKEAMNNTLKHAKASKVTLKATLSKDVLNLSLTDDGKGFELKGEYAGYGQANMQRRAEQLGASISIESSPGKGTIVTFIGTLSKRFETYD